MTEESASFEPPEAFNLADWLLDARVREGGGERVALRLDEGDLTYRGFRASPLIGAGQGLSVYLDGVRINEPFGDVINFDLIPEFAVETISLVPGANPAFGLNSLGGALAYNTFDGRSAPGVRTEVSGGSFGRKRVDASYGRSELRPGESTDVSLVWHALKDVQRGYGVRLSLVGSNGAVFAQTPTLPPAGEQTPPEGEPAGAAAGEKRGGEDTIEGEFKEQS